MQGIIVEKKYKVPLKLYWHIFIMQFHTQDAAKDVNSMVKDVI